MRSPQQTEHRVKPSVTIIDYHAGNLTSVRLAFEAVGAQVRISSDPRELRRADRVVFPGVGAARSAMKTLDRLDLTAAVKDLASSGMPFLGICLGTQILLDETEEDGGTSMLGLIPGEVKLFRPENHFEKVPQVGWNQLRIGNCRNMHPVLEGIADESDFYFVHSYYPVPKSPRNILGTTGYGGIRFASMLGCDNLVATQFHPEKSGKTGLRLLKNFIAWNGCTKIADR